MRIEKINKLRGPNVWANFPVLEAWVNLEELKDTHSALIPGFYERITAWLPSMIEHRCGIGERGGFFLRLREGTYMGHILEHVALELQTLAGTPVGFGRARESHVEGTYKVAIEYIDETVGLACIDTGFRLIQAAINDTPFDVAAEVEKLKDVAHTYCLGPSTGSIANAAKARNIPVHRLNADCLVQLGYGSKQRRFNAAEVDSTGALGEMIAQDKQLTRELLSSIGVPVPDGRIVNTAEEAWHAADELGVPVVVKPQFGNHGRGVAINLTSRDQILAAFETAKAEGLPAIVEHYVSGDDYRMLVVGDKLVAAARREPAHVVGDGIHTIEQLVTEVNKDPRRTDGHATCLSKIKVDTQVLTELGYTLQSVPESGVKVHVRRNANLSTGGTATDVTDQVHPDVAADAVAAARMVGLDIAGLDVIAKDITIPLTAQRGVIVEVNAQPGLRMHLSPSFGNGQPVGEAIVNLMFAPGNDGRIPIFAVTGVNGKTTTTRLISHVMASTGRRVGMTCTDGIYISGRRIDSDDCAGPSSARAVLMNPQVDVAVLETARGGILRAGLAFDFCDVAVVTNIGEGDHLGLNDIRTIEELAKVKRCIVEALAPTGTAVLNANDPLTAAMAEKAPKGAGVLFFARDSHHPILVEHRHQGGRVAFVRDNAVVLAEGPAEFTLISLDRIPLTHGGKIAFQVENVLAAAAACWVNGVPCEQIRNGLQTFSVDGSPARFNILSHNGATMVFDYGHNPSSLMAVLEAVKDFPQRSRTAVYTAAGDRRDSDMVRQGELLAGAFDRVILYEDHYRRGRVPGEIIQLLRKGMGSEMRVSEVREANSWIDAVNEAIRLAKPGELYLVQADQVDETVDHIKRLVASGTLQPTTREHAVAVATSNGVAAHNGVVGTVGVAR